jgi:hypothetical protein
MILNLPLSVQHLFRYADPIFVTVETVENNRRQGLVDEDTMRMLEGHVWWQTLLTTRTLLAHAVLAPDNSTFVPTLASNIRLLLRLVYVDIADKEAFESLRPNEPNAWYKSPDADACGRWWLSLRHQSGTSKGLARTPGEILKGLQYATFKTVSDELNGLKLQVGASDTTMSNGIRGIINLFGHAVYRLVATRDNAWKVTAHEYSVLRV